MACGASSSCERHKIERNQEFTIVIAMALEE